MKQNIGILNALVRITVGLTLLACMTSKMVWRPRRESYLFFVIMGAMKVAEGITRFCPVTAYLEKHQQEQQKNIALTVKEETTGENQSSY